MNTIPLKISVVIITKDNPENLRDLLGSLIDQSQMPDEVVVVHNNSLKNYDTVFDEFRSSLPLKTVLETNPGIPVARNRGIQESNGDLIIFTDDDCIADPFWVQNMVKPFYYNPYIGAVGGEIDSVEKTGTIIEEFCVSETLMHMGIMEKEIK